LIAQRHAYRALDALREEVAKFPHARAFTMAEELDPRRPQKK
jgi:hypothetical protein